MKRIATILFAMASFACAVEEWRDLDFAKRIKVTLDSAHITADGTDFPALLAVTGADEAHGQIAIADITEDKWVVYDGDGNIQPWEKEAYAEGATWATFEIWCKTDIYTSPTGDQNCLWFYYDNSATEANDPTDVWNASYHGVWHLVGLTDSTGHGHDLSNGTNAPDSGATGIVGDAFTFDDGNSESLVIADSLDFTTYPMAIEAWGKSDANAEQTLASICDASATTNYSAAVFDGTAGGDPAEAHTDDGAGDVQAQSAGSYSLDGSTWNYIIALFEADDDRTVILDGTDLDNDTANAITQDVSLYDRFGVGLAYDLSASRYFSGQIDELRAIKDASPSAMTMAQYATVVYDNINESDHAETWSAAEAQPAPGGLPAPGWFHFERMRRAQ